MIVSWLTKLWFETRILICVCRSHESYMPNSRNIQHMQHCVTLGTTRWTSHYETYKQDPWEGPYGPLPKLNWLDQPLEQFLGGGGDRWRTMTLIHVVSRELFVIHARWPGVYPGDPAHQSPDCPSHHSLSGAGPALGFAALSPSLGFGITKGVHHARKARMPDEGERQLQREAWTSRRSRQEKFDEVWLRLEQVRGR